MNVFTTQEANHIVEAYLRHQRVTRAELTDRGARSIVAEIEKRWSKDVPVHVFAGPYDNGALALAVARHLFAKGYTTYATLFNIEIDPAHDACKRQRDLLASSSFDMSRFTEVRKSFKMPQFEKNAIIVDGIFGSELNRTLESGYTSFIKHLNEQKLPIVSLDVPSGMTGDWNSRTVPAKVIKARLTVSLQFPHLAFFLPNMAANVGEWVAVDIGIRVDPQSGVSRKFILVGASEAAHFLRRRNPDCSKADFGNGIIFAGSFGMLGAAVLAGRGALRSGIGKLTISTPLCGFSVIQNSVPEALYQFAESQDFFSRIKPHHPYDAVAIGPGIGTNEATVNALEDYLATVPSPIILDADALNCISLRPALLNKLPNMSVITPHAKEFDRLFGEQPNGDARLLKAMEVSKTYNLIIVLKGRYTAVVRPNGMVTFNNSGTPALATPGSGDVLTGIITSFYAQFKNPVLAAVTAVYVHGLAGRLAAEQHGEYGVTASDIALCTGKAINEIISR